VLKAVSLTAAARACSTPLEVPQVFYDKFDHLQDDKPTHNRRVYHASKMTDHFLDVAAPCRLANQKSSPRFLCPVVNFADEAVGNFTAALKAKNMWEDSLLVFSAE